MNSNNLKKSKTHFAILGVLAFEPSTGYEIKKLISETTAHFWKESYGQIYPALERLLEEGKIYVAERSAGGRGSIRYGILQEGLDVLREWIRSPEFVLKPGRNEILLKLFFARKEDAPYLIPQIESYMQNMVRTGMIYRSFSDEPDQNELPSDSYKLIGTTIDYGVSAAEMQIEWCRRTIKLLEAL